MNYRKVHDLAGEMGRYLNQIQGLYLDAVAGFSFVRSRVVRQQEFVRKAIDDPEIATEVFQDTCTFSYEGIFRQGIGASGIHRATEGEVKKRNHPDGDNYAVLGRLCVVSLFAFWEDHFRREYAVAKGVLDSEEKSEKVVKAILAEHAADDFWGDMGCLRNAIIHNQGIANSKVARCKLIRWFRVKDKINIGPEKMRAIFLSVLSFRNRIFSESHPPMVLRVPVGRYREAAIAPGSELNNQVSK